MTTQEITIIATQTRSDFEIKAFATGYLESLVKKHLSYIAEDYEDRLTQWIKNSVTGFPENGCELASAVLLERIGEGNIVYGRYVHEPIGPHNIRKSHAFWCQSETVGNEILIADVTADQYGGPKVYAGKLTPPWTLPDWSAELQ